MKKKDLENNFYAFAKDILYQHIDMGPPRTTSGEPLRELPLTKDQQQLKDPEYWKSMQPHPEYGNIYFPYHCTHEGWTTFRVENCEGHIAGEHLNFPTARALARKLNEGGQA